MPYDGRQPALDIRTAGPPRPPAQDAPRSQLAWHRHDERQAACALYDEMLWECSRNENCHPTVLQELRRRCSEMGLRAHDEGGGGSHSLGRDWNEADHPRGQSENKGQFSKGDGGGAKAPEASEVPDAVKQHKQFAPFFERGALEPRTRTNSYGKQEIEFHPHPSANIQSFHAGREDQPDKVAYFDPRYAELQTLNEDDPIIARQIAVPKEGIETEFNPPADPNAIYRGISAEEYAAIQQTGEVRSQGEFNIGPEQEGLTYWTSSPSMANSYANGFAPAAMKPTPDRPAYIVSTRMPQETKRVQGTGKEEVGVARPIKREEITGIWRGDPITYEPGNYSMPDQFSSGVSGVAPSATLRWSRIDQAGSSTAQDLALDIRTVGPRRLGQDKFDPSEPRDETGEWTEGGGAAGKAAEPAPSPKPKPGVPVHRRKGTETEPEGWYVDGVGPWGTKEAALNYRREAEESKYRVEVRPLVDQLRHRVYMPPSDKPEENQKGLRDNIEKIYSVVARRMGMPAQSDKYQVVFDKPPTFKIGDRTGTYAGSCNLKTKVVKVYTQSAGIDSMPDIMAHELEHQKFAQVWDKYLEDKDKLWADAKNEDIMRPDDSIRDKYKGNYPFFEKLQTLFDVGKLAKDDGITDYSREWWRAWKDGKADSMATVHETMAEMAKLDWEGSLHRLVWFKDSTTWKPLYEAVNELYDTHIKPGKTP